MSQGEKDLEGCAPRILKFRLWAGGSMGMVGQMDFFVEDGFYNVNGEWPVGSYPSPENKLMQFIGIKDKDGDDIYEGDVIEAKITEWSLPTMGEIRYSEEYHAFANYNDGGVTLLLKLSDFKILGNIYENPELLHKEPLAEGPRLAESNSPGGSLANPTNLPPVADNREGE